MLKISLARALEHSGLKVVNATLKSKISADYELENIIGKSRPMKALIDMMAKVAPSEATILITGESGTGKELPAKSIHHNSWRKDRPIVVVNCAALTETLLESELFGHEKGSFTGADKRHKRVKSFSPLAMDMLLKYPWPGNVRELENVMERAVILLPDEHVTEKELPATITESYAEKGDWVAPPQPVAANRPLEKIEREAILAPWKPASET